MKGSCHFRWIIYINSHTCTWAVRYFFNSVYSHPIEAFYPIRMVTLWPFVQSAECGFDSSSPLYNHYCISNTSCMVCEKCLRLVYLIWLSKTPTHSAINLVPKSIAWCWFSRFCVFKFSWIKFIVIYVFECIMFVY